jgi:hypothetical protein
MSLAEKFQITVPVKVEGGEDFVSFDSARVNNYIPEGGRAKLNGMPETDLCDCASDGFVQGFGGNTDVSGGVNAGAMQRGFSRYDMKGTDDQYGGEHIDLFYGEVEDEKGNVGFAERNNYLDRI